MSVIQFSALSPCLPCPPCLISTHYFKIDRLLEADGLLMGIGYLLTIANTVFFVFIIYALWQAPNLLPSFFK